MAMPVQRQEVHITFPVPVHTPHIADSSAEAEAAPTFTILPDPVPGSTAEAHR